jgi:uncharacterized membrane protein
MPACDNRDKIKKKGVITMPIFMPILALLLVMFWLVVLYYIVTSEKERRRRHDEESDRHWPLHHA